MRFGQNMAQTSRVCWVWARPGAQDLGIATPFASRDWEQWTVWPDLGEVYRGYRAYNNSQRQSSQPGTRGPCGFLDVWQNGWPGTVPPYFPRNAFGVALCCAGLEAPWGRPTLGFVPQAVFAWPWVPPPRWPRPVRVKAVAEVIVKPCPALWVAVIPVVKPWTPRRMTIYPARIADPKRVLLLGPVDPADTPMMIVGG